MRPVLFVPLVMLCACNAFGDAQPLAADATAKCVARGIAYFRSIGSYPALKLAPQAGRPAETVALERCRKTPLAF